MHLGRLPGTTAVLAIALPTLMGLQAAAFEGAVPPQLMEQAPVYSPYAGRGYPDRVLFGDLHFHTELSFDAGLVGTTLSPHEAFRVARGEEIISNTGQRVQLVRPLDFLAITEHAEMLGIATAMRTSDPRLAQDEWGGRILAQFNSGQEGRMAAFGEIIDARNRPGRRSGRASRPRRRSLDGSRGRDRPVQRSRGLQHARRVRMDASRRRATTCTASCCSATGPSAPARPGRSRSSTRRIRRLWDYLAAYEADTAGVRSRCHTTAT